ncbi:MAG: response regulator, partial [Chitinophagaceae bacterium]
MSQTKLKVLVMEQELTLFDELADFCEKKGFDVLYNEQHKPVQSYEEAVQLVETKLPDLAILDVQLKSGKDGIDLGAYIRKHFFTPVIFLSANDDFPELERASSIAANGFVIKAEKPIDKDQLWISIRLAMPLAELKKKRKIISTSFKVQAINPLEYFSSRIIKGIQRPELA